ncbi:hypothetical protein ACFQWB_03230 [Paenibacillus thermoaerophilus]|uniref:Uncharacterized protein n=1 Tax=Paenibacillus thermoaerophilus TaxID=1215385 RepID=A0ABW2V1T6_9BACL|nr:hypothetical protein [Paenibacillus thermoaerophilus]TMV07391.1 hypothetical protein FE781_15720 [Paenibacillus thermoaerophilus]
MDPNLITQEHKEKVLRRAISAGIVKDPHWADRLNEPMPVWVVLELLLALKQQLDDPPCGSYD